MKILGIVLIVILSAQNVLAASCPDYSGTYKCQNKTELDLKQTDCRLLEIKETDSNGQSIQISWLTDWVAHYETPGAYSHIIWTAYHSPDGIHHFVGAYDSYLKETVTYRRRVSLSAEQNLNIYYLKARNGVVELEQTSLCVR